MSHSGLIFDVNQTLFGVITTLVVLCVVFNDSNFVHRLLQDIRKQIDKGLSDLKLVINYKGVTDRPEYTLLKVILKKEPQTEEERNINGQCAKWLAGFSLMKNGDGVGIVEDVEEIKNEMKAIEDAEEPKHAALYSFAYALMFITFDGICEGTYINCFEKLLIELFYTFTCISILYWLMVWVGYFIAPRKSTSEMLHKEDQTINKFFVNMKWICLGYVTIECVLWIILYFLRINPSICLWITIGTFVLIFLLIAYLFLYRVYLSGEASKMTISTNVNHFIIFFGISVVVITLIDALPLWPLTPFAFHITHLRWLSIGAVLFTLLNGLILPFILPYIKFKLLELKARKCYDKEKEIYDQRIKDKIKELEDLHQHIKSNDDI